jgi:transcription initiation factor IIE alpha subunit
MRKYIDYYRCVECLRLLTWIEHMDSHGVCPHCGHVSRGTICEATKVSVEEEDDPTMIQRLMKRLKDLLHW